MPLRVLSLQPPKRKKKKCKTNFNPINIQNIRIKFHPSPPLRGYLLEGQFFIAAALASTLTKLAMRYLQQVSEPQSRNVSMGMAVCVYEIVEV